MWRQPKSVWAVAFASVIAFMGIGLVDPILKSIAADLDASPSQVSLLFTSYMAVTAVAMLITGWVSSRFGAKKTLLLGLVVIIVGSGCAGLMNSIGGVVGFRAVWGLGNALFVATALSAIVGSAAGSIAEAIILYEAALGVGIAAGPLIGGQLGSISWRGPFFGVAALMLIAVVVVAVLLPDTKPTGAPTSIVAPLKALRHGALLRVALTSLFYNFGFFTLLAFTPFPLEMSATQVGFIFFGWGVLLALSSVFVAPWVQRRIGTVAATCLALGGFAVVLAVMAVFTDHRYVLAGCVVVAGFFLGINNTLVTELVMKAAPVERPVASAAYSFVRFGGGAIAPYLAGKIGEHNAHLPFWIGAVMVAIGMALLASGRSQYAHVDAEAGHGAPSHGSVEEAELVTLGDD